MLLCASGESRDIDGRVVAPMEVLGAQTATSLLTARVVAELTDRSRRDPMTGLGHHATFHDFLSRLLTADPGDRHVAVLLIDVDGFKDVNDTHGHSVGDQVLRELVDTLGAELRDGDELFRLGGDEFVTAVLVNDELEAAAIATRLVEAARRHAPPTISIGIAIQNRDDDATRLLRRADAAMYQAKRSGRDTISVVASGADHRS